MAIFRGLNVSRLLNDVDNKQVALNSLGLDLEDLDAIRGIFAGAVDKTELGLLAGLVDDQRKTLTSLASAAGVIAARSEAIADYRFPFDFNLKIDNKFSGAAIKFNFTDFNTGQTDKQADISTSRVSSWSSTSPGKIFYGGEVKVIGQRLTLDNIAVSSAPIPKQFRAEVPTHKVEIVVEDDIGTQTIKSVYAMKGIPLEFIGEFKNATFYHSVEGITDSLGTIPPAWRVTDLDTNQSYSNSSLAVGGTADSRIEWPFYSTSPKERKVEFFYRPDKILRLELINIKLTEWPNVQLPNIQYIDISQNSFTQIPKFSAGTQKYGTTVNTNPLAPNLEFLNMSYNYELGVAEGKNQVTANKQLQYLPETLTDLVIRAAFSDDEAIDLTHLPNLEYLNLSALKLGSTTLAQRMSDTGVQDTFEKTRNIGTVASNVVTITDHGYADGELVQYSGTTNGDLINGGLYYIDIIDANTFNVSSTPLDSPTTVNVSTSGVGSFVWVPRFRPSPRVNASAPIKVYDINRQNLAFRTLADSICDSETVEVLHIFLTRIQGRETAKREISPGTGIFVDVADADATDQEKDVTVKSPQIKSFYTYFGEHGMVDLSNRVFLEEYIYRGCLLPAYSGARTLASKIAGCSSLRYVLIDRTQVEDNIENCFSNLGNLEDARLWYTSMYGRLTSSSFANSNKLLRFEIQGGKFGKSGGIVDDDLARDDFFGVHSGSSNVNEIFKETTNMYRLLIQDNTSIGGDLPDFSKVSNFQQLFINDTSLGSRLNGVEPQQFPSFAGNTVMKYIVVPRNEFKGSVPSFSLANLITLNLSRNRFDGIINPFECVQLNYVYLNNNQLTGAIPNFRGCPRLQILNLSFNNLSSYVYNDEIGGIRDNTQLREVNFSNNQLTAQDGINIINDLKANYDSSPRSGVVVNLVNNNKLTRGNINDNTVAGNNLAALEAFGWTILLDE